MITPKEKWQKVLVFAEFILVISILLAFFIRSAFSWSEGGAAGAIREIVFENDDALYLIAYEALMLLVLAVYLWLRGKRWRDFTEKLNLNHFTAGMILFVVNYVAYLLLFRLAGSFLLSLHFDAGSIQLESYSTSFIIDITLPVLILYSVLNGFFEEFVLVSFPATFLRGQLPGLFILFLSCLFRLSFHFYQGPIILVSILPMGIIHFVFFWYKPSIVSITLSHAIMDFLSFYIYMMIE